MNYDVKSLEKKLNNISNISDNITNDIKKLTNKKKIGLILYVFFFVFNYYYYTKNKKTILKTNFLFSQNYLLGSDWYIGEIFFYSYVDFYNELDPEIKLKISYIIIFLFIFI